MLIELKKKETYKLLYLLSVFLIGLPPFFLGFPFLNLHSLAKVIWLGIFICIFFGVFKTKKIGKEKTLLWLFLAFFAIQGISVVSARSIFAYLRQFEDIAFTAVFVVISFYTIEAKRDVKRILFVLLLSGVVNLLLQFILFVAPNAFLAAGEPFLHPDYLELIRLNIDRKRIYFEVYDEALIPIVFYLAFKPKAKRKGTSILYLVSLSVFSFVSNFRTRFLMLLFALTGSFAAFLRHFAKTIIPVIGALAALIFFVYSLMFRNVGFTVIERFALEDKYEDVKTVTNRLENWQQAANIGLSAPLTGVGLGNYFDYLEESDKHTYSVFQQKQREFQYAAFYPHNIFFKAMAETGVIGVALLIGMFLYFLKEDLKILSGKNMLAKALVVGFWTLVMHSLFNPSFTAKYQVSFWLFRVLVEKEKWLKGELVLG